MPAMANTQAGQFLKASLVYIVCFWASSGHMVRPYLKKGWEKKSCLETRCGSRL